MSAEQSEPNKLTLAPPNLHVAARTTAHNGTSKLVNPKSATAAEGMARAGSFAAQDNATDNSALLVKAPAATTQLEAAAPAVDTLPRATQLKGVTHGPRGAGNSPEGSSYSNRGTVDSLRGELPVQDAAAMSQAGQGRLALPAVMQHSRLSMSQGLLSGQSQPLQAPASQSGAFSMSKQVVKGVSLPPQLPLNALYTPLYSFAFSSDLVVPQPSSLEDTLTVFKSPFACGMLQLLLTHTQV